MKVTITLSKSQVEGIKKYLEVNGVYKPTKMNIQQEIASEVNALLQSPRCAIADYIQQEK